MAQKHRKQPPARDGRDGRDLERDMIDKPEIYNQLCQQDGSPSLHSSIFSLFTFFLPGRPSLPPQYLLLILKPSIVFSRYVWVIVGSSPVPCVVALRCGSGTLNCCVERIQP